MSKSDNPPTRTAEDHAVAITEAIERLITGRKSGDAQIHGLARAALAEAIKAALESVRAPEGPGGLALTGGEAPGAGSHERGVAEHFGALQERAAIVAWLREHEQGDTSSNTLALRIERGEHLSPAAACTCPARAWGAANAARTGSHHAPACPLHRRGAP